MLIHKEARFLSIITIPCLLVLGYVLTRNLSSKRRRAFLWVTIGFLSLSSLFFIAFKRTLQRSEFENLRTTASYLRQLPGNRDIYVDYDSARYLHYLLGYKLLDQLQLFQQHDYRTGENMYPVDLHQVHQAFVIVNWHMINTLQYKGFTRITYPEIIYAPPDYWNVVHTIQASDNWVYVVFQGFLKLPFFHALPSGISQKIRTTAERVLKSHKEQTIMYWID